MSDAKTVTIDLNDPRPTTMEFGDVVITFSVADAQAPAPSPPKPAGQPHLLVEMWESKDKGWERLTREERQDILNQIKVGVGDLARQGLEPLGFFVNNPNEGRHREHWQFVAVWRLPSKELLDKMLPQVDTLPGWFDVMHELRVWGRILDPVTEGEAAMLNVPYEPPAPPAASPGRGVRRTGEDRA